MDDPNTTLNPTPTENSIPSSPQGPTADAPIPTTVSTPAEVPPRATEASGASFSAKSDNIPPSNSAPLGGFSEAKTEEIQASSDTEVLADRENEGIEADEPSPKPDSIPETAQMGRNDPLGEVMKPEPKSQTFTKSIRELFTKALDARQNRKRKKLDCVMTLFAKQTKITNDEVEKLLHVSDSTATRYLATLEKEGKIKQNTKKGYATSYSKI